MAYATFEQMATARPGRIDPADMARAEFLLEEASGLIDEEVGPLWAEAWADPEVVLPTTIRSVCIQVALRVFDNPSSISMEQATGYMFQRPQSHVTGLELTKGERARVRRAIGKAAAYSVQTPATMDETTIGAVQATDVL